MKPFFCLFVAVFYALGSIGCQRTPPAAASQENNTKENSTKEYAMHGEVVSLDPNAQLATVKHEKIEGWMGAMTMEYPVKDKQQFQKLKVGDLIQAQILVQGTDYWIGTISEQPAK